MVARILKIFWGGAGEYNFDRLGVRVAGPRGDERVAGPRMEERHIHAVFDRFLLDERAEKFIANVKGSSGSKMCMS